MLNRTLQCTSCFFVGFGNSAHTVCAQSSPVLPPTLTKHTHAGRYSWNHKSVVHQCLIRFHGIPLIPLARVFHNVYHMFPHIRLKSNCVRHFTISGSSPSLEFISSRTVSAACQSSWSKSMIKPFKQFFSFGCANSNIHIRTKNAVRILTV